MNELSQNMAIDPHLALAHQLGVKRMEAKSINYALAYGATLTVTTGQGASIIHCHRIAELWPKPWGAAKGAEWEWLTQDRPFYLSVAFETIAKFLPDIHPDTQSLGWDFLEMPGRLKQAHDIATRGLHEDQLQQIEELLRPVAYVLKANGHQFN